MNTRQHQTTASALRRFTKASAYTLIIATFLATVALAQNAVPFLNQPLSPEQKAPGSATFTLTVHGTGFASDSVVKWNGTALTTTFVTDSKLTASVPAANVKTASTANVTVENGSGTASNVDHFQIVKNGYTTAFSYLNYTTDTDPQDITTADFNGDGIADLAVATGNNTVSILLGAGAGVFPTHVQYSVPGNPVAIIAGDFNGDGKMDLATADQFQAEVSVLLGNGDGTFQAHTEYATGSQPLALATADVNGDGKLDLIVVNARGNTVSILLGNGNGTFQTHKDYSTIPTTGGTGDPLGVAVGDFNGDGKLDLAIANNADNAVAILFGNGDGTFQAAVEYPTAILPNSVVVGDFNGDGILDLGVGTSNKSVSVLLGNANGTFQNHVEYTIGGNAVVVAAADLSSSGKLSLISANFADNSVSTLLGNGDGTFKSQSVFPVALGPSGLAIADYNNNGKLDIAVVASGSNAVSVLSDSPVTFSPGLISFGTQTSGEKSAAKDLTIKNTGTTPWTMGPITFAGTDYPDFTISTNTCPASGSTLAVGASCVVGIIFEPTASETADAQVLVTTSAGVFGNVLQGSGNIPITLTPRTMTFKYQLIGTTTKQTDTFTNDSGVNILFSNIDLEGVNENQFSFTSTCAGGGPPFNFTVPLTPGASCTSTVSYTPTVSGGANVTQVYYGNFTLVKQGLLISGEATAVKVTPTSLTLNTKANATVSGNVTFQNAGAVPLAISSINFINGVGGNPSWGQTNTCNYPNGSVPANSSCTITVSCTPAADGTYTADMSIGSSDPEAPESVSLTCKATN